MMATDRPRLLSSRPIEATAIPLPTDDATPPVTNKYFVMRCSPEIPIAAVLFATVGLLASLASLAPFVLPALFALSVMLLCNLPSIVR